MTTDHPPRLGSGRIKGAAFLEFLRWYSKRPDGDLRALVSQLPPGLAEPLDPGRRALGVLSSRWYEASLVHALLDRIVEGRTPDEREDLALEGSRAVMDATLSGIYRVLFHWMATPERYARHAPKLWSSYYDSGRFTVTPEDDGLGAVSVIREFRSHHAFLCRLNWGAAIAIYEALGCEGVSCERTSCVDIGGDECRFVTRWR